MCRELLSGVSNNSSLSSVELFLRFVCSSGYVLAGQLLLMRQAEQVKVWGKIKV